MFQGQSLSVTSTKVRVEHDRHGADSFVTFSHTCAVEVLMNAVLLWIPLLLASPPDSLDRAPFRNPSLPLSARVDDLLSRMSTEEKIAQLLYNAPAIERLGIPSYNWWSEALHGVARAGRATVFPQSIGLAATFDAELMHRVSVGISDEARAKYHDALRCGGTGIYEGLTFFSPNINIFRDPRWGRGMETYGEDPHLTSRMAVSFIRGMQGDDPRYLKTAATAKHFAVHSGPEPDRHRFDARVSERDLRETYLPAFRASVVEAQVASVMCAYNRYFGEPCCGNPALLQRILRDDWKFDGYVVSDCWAISDFWQFHRTSRDQSDAAATALMAGTDVECGVSFDSLRTALRLGLVREADIDRALRRALEVRFRLGMFDPSSMVPFASIGMEVLDRDEHRQLALDAARKSIVLLRNEGDLLPLRKDLRRIAVIGPTIDDVDVLLGNYNGTPSEAVTILQGIWNAVDPSTEVMAAKGSDVTSQTPIVVPVAESALFTEAGATRRQGLRAEYGALSHTGRPIVSATDGCVDFNWWDSAPAPGVPADSFFARWVGVLVPPVSGTYELGGRVFGQFRMWLNDTLFTEYSDRHVVYTQTRTVHLEEGRPYRLRLEFVDRRRDALMQLVWSVPDPRQREKAIDAARRSDVAILVLGLTPRLEGEEMPVAVEGFAGGDRTSLDLPREQEDLLKAVVATGTPVVLVLMNGSAVSINWASEHVPAIVEAWYPGQAAGTALADVLFGDVNPAGRLPVTFYRSVDQLPPFDDYAMTDRTYRYFTGEPLYPFGYGLSYTSFSYDALLLPVRAGAGDTITASVTVRNSGRRAGDEVVQWYVSLEGRSDPAPIRSLVGFERITLSPGESRRITRRFTPRELASVDRGGRLIHSPGRLRLSVGGEQPGMRGRLQAPTTGTVSGRVRITGEARVMAP
jgi:beta-glucosidase